MKRRLPWSDGRKRGAIPVWRKPRCPRGEAAIAGPAGLAAERVAGTAAPARLRAPSFSRLRVFAHDFWIEPATWAPVVGESFSITLRVGEHGRGDSRPRQPDRIERFWIRSPGPDLPVKGAAGDDPAGRAVSSEDGPHVICFRGQPIPIEIPAAGFEAYLEEEGLDEIRDIRRARGESGKPGREIYSRCAKCLVAAGGRGGAEWTRPVGMPFELTPESVPETGADLTVRLEFEGRAFPAGLVFARSLDQPEIPLRLRTDASGCVRFHLGRPGPWLVTSVRMVPCRQPELADWESFWASLTFEVRPH